MLDPIDFVLAVIALLATPGPTNTLLAASGATIGFQRALILLPAEMSGYLISILALAALLDPITALYPFVLVGLKLLAGVWLAYCAIHLWCDAGVSLTRQGSSISIGKVFLTTLINPKAFIFASVIIPSGPIAFMVPWLAAFCGLALAIGACWIALGALLARHAQTFMTPRRIWRVASIALAAFAMIMVRSALAAMP